MKSKKNTTIYDIATLAGVSPATVSNVINGKGKCSAEKKEEILQIIKNSGYTPNLHARKLTKRNRYTIAISFHLSHPKQTFQPHTEAYPSNYLEQFLLGAIHSAMQYDCDILFAPTVDEHDSEKAFSYILEKSSGYDGIIFDHTPSFLDKLHYHSLPYVYAGPPNSSISPEHNVYGGLLEYYQKVLQIFYEHKVQHLILFLGTLELQFSQLSRDHHLNQIIQEFCSTHPVPKDFIHVMYYNMDDSFQLMMLLSGIIKEKNRPEAMFFTDTLAAVTAYNYLQENGIRIPKDIRIIATSFSPTAGREFVPALSSIYVNSFQMGFRAVELLLHQLSPKEYPKKDSFIPFQYIERDSV